MTEKVPYSFTILRYVHDVVAAESLNVGVVVYNSTEGSLLVRTQRSMSRLRQAFPDIDPQGLRGMLASVERGIESLAQELMDAPLLVDRQLDVLKCARRVLPDDDSALQWSTAGWGLTADLTETTDRLFERYVTRHDQTAAQEERRRTDDDIRRAFKSKLNELGAKIPFEPKRIRGSQDEITFETAWKNGKWHAYEPVSLDLADEKSIKDKARRWRGHLSAVEAGSTDDVRVHFLVGGPRDESLHAAFENAKTILSGSPFASGIVEDECTDRFVEQIKTEYLSSIRGEGGGPVSFSFFSNRRT